MPPSTTPAPTTNKKSKSNKKNPASYTSVKMADSANDDHKILMDELYPPTSGDSTQSNNKAFDFTSIQDYKSIYKYNNSSHHAPGGSHGTMFKHGGQEQTNEVRPLSFIEHALNFAILGLFYGLLAIFFPFSLYFCLKKVKENERIVVYRLGRVKSPEYKPGYCILFPVIDSFQRFDVVLKEFALTNLQVLNHENSIADTSLQVRYRINDVIKAANSVKDVTHMLKSLARSIMVGILSKKDSNRIEVEAHYMKQDIRNALNAEVMKFGIEIIEVELIINSITEDEDAENKEDPALKSITTVFKSIFGGGGGSSSSAATKSELQSDPVASGFLNFLTPFLNPGGDDDEIKKDGLNVPPPTKVSASPAELINMMNNPDFQRQMEQAQAGSLNTATTPVSQDGNVAGSPTPHKLIALLQPQLNETLVKEINTVYEFHIKTTGNNKSQFEFEADTWDVYYLDLKNVPKGQVGVGASVLSKADCVIKTTDKDLHELITDKMKPFTAYMSGRIEIDGDLQDVYKLKKLIKAVTAAVGPLKASV